MTSFVAEAGADWAKLECDIIAAVEEEREACAQIADKEYQAYIEGRKASKCFTDTISNIRARGNKD